jgi:hypothetical protein
MAPALEPLWAVSAVSWWASPSWQFRVSDQSWQRAGWSHGPRCSVRGGRGWCGLLPLNYRLGRRARFYAYVLGR